VKEKKSLSFAHIFEVKKIAAYSFIAIISGLSGFAFITTVNGVIENLIKSGLPNEHNYLLIFSVIILTFFITRRLLSEGVINISQQIYWNMRRDIIKLVLKAPFRKVQQYKDEVYSTLTADVNNITNASLLIINFFSSIILIVACLIYMAYLSWSLFKISLSVICLGVLVYLFSVKKGNLFFSMVRDLEEDFIKVFNSILGGIKEIKVAPSKGESIYEQKLIPVIQQGKAYNERAFLNYLNSQIISQLCFYGLITFILIYAIAFLDITVSKSVNFVFVLLYLLGPIVNVMISIPHMSQAMISLNRLAKIKADLQQMETEHSEKVHILEGAKSFNKLEFKDYLYSFGADKFKIGPVNLTINRNEVIYIYGGNGAGKTTFINTLLNLYHIDSGDVYLDGTKIEQTEINKIKEMFAPVFSDFFLFDEFYGIDPLDIEKAKYYLKVFELEEKVHVKDRKFSTIDLSTGQRKRLALIQALLENKPILVLDEWAADQDPYFRNKFYTEILPLISQQEDKTVIAITHDDRYFQTANKLYKMEYGQLHLIANGVEQSIF
jgi:putative pyoverdin transport system ATP-binding/permease protein